MLEVDVAGMGLGLLPGAGQKVKMNTTDKPFFLTNSFHRVIAVSLSGWWRFA